MSKREQFELTALESGLHQKNNDVSLTKSSKDILTRTLERATATDRKTFSSLEWQNIGFDVGDRVILKNISGSVSPGRLCAIIGASGAGKTSLLNILAGRLQGASRSAITGEIFLNGEKVDPRNLGGDIAYVMQHDALFATQTPREALEFSAALRLPKSVTKEDRTKMVNTLLRLRVYSKFEQRFTKTKI